jgi:hypothetical protein
MKLELLGLDDNSVTCRHAGRFERFSQFCGKVIGKLIP